MAFYLLMIDLMIVEYFVSGWFASAVIKRGICIHSRQAHRQLPRNLEPNAKPYLAFSALMPAMPNGTTCASLSFQDY
jgi:hypothetical protein